jgi:hypothetical protein
VPALAVATPTVLHATEYLAGHQALSTAAPSAAAIAYSRRRLLWLVPGLICVAILCLWLPSHVRGSESAAVDRFWAPVLHEKRTPLLVTGANVFSANPYSGTETADRSTDYPFLSMQIAAAMTRVSGQLQRKGSDVEIQSANTTTLSDLRDRPVILVGGYNNDWTVRLVQPLPFRLAPKAQASIMDTSGKARWERDHNLPYSAADDFAIIGRYRDQTSGSVTVVLAGLGRNGTEAAAQFVTDPHYMQQLEQHLGHRIDDHNVEAVLKINVIQGKTGAPSIMSVRSW